MPSELILDDRIASQVIPAAEGAPELEILRANCGSAGPPVLFLHGYTSGAWQFTQHVLPALAQEGRTSWALNLRGHGNSGGRDGVRNARFADYAADVARAVAHVERAEGTTPILVGHSLGSVLARDYAARHKVPGLALVSFGDIKLGMKDFMGWMMRKYPVKSLAGMVTGRPSALFTEFDPQYAVMYDGHPREAVQANVERLMAQPDSDKLFMELGKLSLGKPLGDPPVLVMAGDQDVIASPRSVAALSNALGVPAVVIEGEAHDIFASPAWQTAFEPLRDWLQQILPTTAPKNEAGD